MAGRLPKRSKKPCFSNLAFWDLRTRFVSRNTRPPPPYCHSAVERAVRLRWTGMCREVLLAAAKNDQGRETSHDSLVSRFPVRDTREGHISQILRSEE